MSMLKTMGDAYKVVALQGARLSPLHLFHLATMGSALALGVADEVASQV